MLSKINRHLILRNRLFISTSTTNYFRRGNRKDPGISRRAKILDDDFKNEIQDEEDIAGLETDFDNAHHVIDDIRREKRAMRDYIGKKITIKKFFSAPKPPNMLTWAERLQIRKLHEENPEEWTLDVLAESFPAPRETISKILKISWVPETLNKMKRKDAIVRENWKKLEEGRLDADPALLEHLKKFLPRREDYLASIASNDYQSLLGEPKPEYQWNKGQMSSILSSYEKTLKRIEEKQQILLQESSARLDSGPNRDYNMEESLEGKTNKVLLGNNDYESKDHFDQSPAQVDLVQDHRNERSGRRKDFTNNVDEHSYEASNSDRPGYENQEYVLEERMKQSRVNPNFRRTNYEKSVTYDEFINNNTQEGTKYHIDAHGNIRTPRKNDFGSSDFTQTSEETNILAKESESLIHGMKPSRMDRNIRRTNFETSVNQDDFKKNNSRMEVLHNKQHFDGDESRISRKNEHVSTGFTNSTEQRNILTETDFHQSSDDMKISTQEKNPISKSGNINSRLASLAGYSNPEAFSLIPTRSKKSLRASNPPGHVKPPLPVTEKHMNVNHTLEEPIFETPDNDLPEVFNDVKEFSGSKRVEKPSKYDQKKDEKLFEEARSVETRDVLTEDRNDVTEFPVSKEVDEPYKYDQENDGKFSSEKTPNSVLTEGLNDASEFSGSKEPLKDDPENDEKLFEVQARRVETPNNVRTEDRNDVRESSVPKRVKEPYKYGPENDEKLFEVESRSVETPNHVRTEDRNDVRESSGPKRVKEPYKYDPENEKKLFEEEARSIEGTFFWSKGETQPNSETTGQLVKAPSEGKMAKASSYPQRIKIPRNKRGSGLTFRVNDCFYDCDGQFLYRVPGLVVKDDDSRLE